jgi:K+-H+ exchange-related protein
MDVFLVPVAPDRYELYCEEQEAPAPSIEAAHRGVFRRLLRRFRDMLAEAERDRRSGGPPAEEGPRTLAGRIKARTMRWVAESIAEQRLLWQLRGRAEACLIHPDDLTDAHAREILRRQLNRDFERHRFWLAINTVCMIAAIALVILPGPNVVWYYFAFRVVGHYLSVRGARHGVTKTDWTATPSRELAALRAVIGVAPDERDQRVRELASTLRLEHLATFFQRTAIP